MKYVEECVNALSYLKQQTNFDAEAAKTLGVEVEQKFLGYTVEEWETDIKNRVKQLSNYALIKKYRDAIEILEKHLSEDDKFNRDMQIVEDLLK